MITCLACAQSLLTHLVLAQTLRKNELDESLEGQADMHRRFEDSLVQCKLMLPTKHLASIIAMVPISCISVASHLPEEKNPAKDA